MKGEKEEEEEQGEKEETEERLCAGVVSRRLGEWARKSVLSRMCECEREREGEREIEGGLQHASLIPDGGEGRGECDGE